MIGNRIKFARAARKRSQQWLADEVGVTQSSVSEWETIKTDPATENLKRIAKVLDVDFEWLATGRGEMVSTHSRPKAAGTAGFACAHVACVSTHSRPKAAGS